MSTSSPVWLPDKNPQGLTSLEVASGVVVGQGDLITLAPSARDPIAVLRQKCVELLATPPCVVAFSGGRDSSALLALLVDCARSEGLDQPIAVTARWDEDQASSESAWQEEVIRSIGVTEWEILRPGTDLDLLGEEATTALSSRGLMWPAPAYALRPLMRRARGGVLLSGEGGDEAFGLYGYGRLWESVRNRKVPESDDLRSLALGLLPRPVRRRRWEHNFPAYQTWLRPGALTAVSYAMGDDRADDPLRWDRYQEVSRRRRAMDLTLSTLEALSDMEGARYAGPFLDTEFLSAMAHWGGKLGRGDRSDVMIALFEDVLPGPILSRVSKASFAGVFWGPRSRAFAEQWDGSTGMDPTIVDPDALRAAWLAPTPVYGAALPLHAAWLATQEL